MNNQMLKADQPCIHYHSDKCQGAGETNNVNEKFYLESMVSPKNAGAA